MQCKVGMEVTCAALKTVVRKDLWVRVPRPALQTMPSAVSGLIGMVQDDILCSKHKFAFTNALLTFLDIPRPAETRERSKNRSRSSQLVLNGPDSSALPRSSDVAPAQGINF